MNVRNNVAITLVLMGIGLGIVRICTLGFDCGLLSVWFAGMAFNLTAFVLDAISGFLVGAGYGMLYLLHQRDIKTVKGSAYLSQSPLSRGIPLDIQWLRDRIRTRRSHSTNKK